MKALFTALAITAFALHAALAAPQEIPKGSKLRAQLFDLARPTIEKQAGKAVKFADSQRRLGEWAFFIGQIVNAKGGPIYVYDSPETLLLWKQVNGTWTFLTGEAGANEPFHLWEWPAKYGAPKELFE
jgi:hypothetical protein